MGLESNYHIEGRMFHMLKYQTISKNRVKYGLTQEHLSRLTGIRKEQISKIENGKIMNPTLLTLEKIAFALNLKIADLIDETRPTV